MGDFYQCQWSYRICFISIEMDFIHIAGNCVIFRTPFRSILQKFLRNFWIMSISREKTPFIFSMFDYTYLQIWTFFISRLYVKYILLQELFRQRILVFNQKCKIWIWYDMSSKKKLSSKIFLREIMWEFQFNEKH